MEGDLSFRSANSQDIPTIQHLISRIWPKAYSHILSAEQTAYMLDMMYSDSALQTQLSTGHHFIIADLDGVPSGFASWEKKGDHLCKLHKIYVLPDSQGSGIGKKLITCIRELAIEEGCFILQLNVNRNNIAKSFYEKIGFSVVREEDIDIGAGYLMNDYVMQMSIG